MSAGSNERLFRELIIQKFGNNCLSGKKRFSIGLDDFPKVSISVDESIEKNDKTILIEIDSGNMAKLIAGQYALLNGMYGGDRTKTLFLVIHYYQDGKTHALYNRDRTLKNLNAIRHFNPKANWISFNAYNIEEFQEILDNSNSLESLITEIWDKRN